MLQKTVRLYIVAEHLQIIFRTCVISCMSLTFLIFRLFGLKIIFFQCLLIVQCCSCLHFFNTLRLCCATISSLSLYALFSIYFCFTFTPDCCQIYFASISTTFESHELLLSFSAPARKCTWFFPFDFLTFNAAKKPDTDMHLAITSQQPVWRSWSCLCGVTAQGIWVCPLKHHQTMQFI